MIFVYKHVKTKLLTVDAGQDQVRGKTKMLSLIRRCAYAKRRIKAVLRIV